MLEGLAAIHTFDTARENACLRAVKTVRWAADIILPLCCGDVERNPGPHPELCAVELQWAERAQNACLGSCPQGELDAGLHPPRDAFFFHILRFFWHHGISALLRRQRGRKRRRSCGAHLTRFGHRGRPDCYRERLGVHVGDTSFRQPSSTCALHLWVHSQW